MGPGGRVGSVGTRSEKILPVGAGACVVAGTRSEKMFPVVGTGAGAASN